MPELTLLLNLDHFLVTRRHQEVVKRSLCSTLRLSFQQGLSQRPVHPSYGWALSILDGHKKYKTLKKIVDAL